jgi:hypothetical protein
LTHARTLLVNLTSHGSRTAERLTGGRRLVFVVHAVCRVSARRAIRVDREDFDETLERQRGFPSDSTRDVERRERERPGPT